MRTTKVWTANRGISARRKGARGLEAEEQIPPDARTERQGE
jgi:hypothetical protein